MPSDAALLERQDTRHHIDEIARVAGPRVASFLLLQDRHRDFGEVIEGEIVDRSSLHELRRSFEPVSPESLAVGDANGFHNQLQRDDTAFRRAVKGKPAAV